MSGKYTTFKRTFGNGAPLSVAIAVVISILFFLVEIGVGLSVQAAVNAIVDNKYEVSLTFFSIDWNAHVESVIVMILMLGMARAGLSCIQSYLQNSAGDRVSARIRQLAFSKLTNSKSGNHIQREYSETSMLMTEFAAKTSTFFENILAILPAIIICLALSSSAIFMGRSIMLGTLLIALLVGLVGKGVNAATRNLAVKTYAVRTQLHQVVHSLYRNLVFIRIMRTEKQEFGRLTGLNVSALNYDLKLGFLRAFTNSIPGASGSLIVCIFLILSSRWAFPEMKSQMIVQLYVLMRISSYSGMLIYLSAELARNFPVVQKVSALLREFSSEELESMTANLHFANLYSVAREPRLPYFRSKSEQDTGERKPPRIDFSNVTFGYANASRSVLNDVSFTVESGEQFGIVGASGSGKSTILSLILGLNRPLRGAVTINDQPVGEYFEKFSHQVGYVGVEPFLIGGTIQQNLDYGSLYPYSEIEYQRVLQQAKLVEVVERFPTGLSHLISDSGEGLSAGEKQRLAIARALLRRPTFLVLDEVSANLDSTTEAEITEMLKSLKGTVTTIIVSHRPAILKHADRVYDAEKNNFALRVREILRSAF